MTDEEVRQQVERTDAFIAAFRELIASTIVDPASPCEAACHRGLERISATVDAVDYVTFANLANMNEAMRGGLMSLWVALCGWPFMNSGRLDLDSRIAAHGPDRKRGRSVVISRNILPAECHYEPG